MNEPKKGDKKIISQIKLKSELKKKKKICRYNKSFELKIFMFI